MGGKDFAYFSATAFTAHSALQKCLLIRSLHWLINEGSSNIIRCPSKIVASLPLMRFLSSASRENLRAGQRERIRQTRMLASDIFLAGGILRNLLISRVRNKKTGPRHQTAGSRKPGQYAHAHAFTFVRFQVYCYQEYRTSGDQRLQPRQALPGLRPARRYTQPSAADRLQSHQRHNALTGHDATILLDVDCSR
jgi:hypothetical protein